MRRVLSGMICGVVVTMGLVLGGWGQTSGQETAIRKVLQSQVEAWNHHDLEAFMAGYWNSPELTFFSGASVTHGWQPTLDRYRKNYQSAGAEMGKLEFQDLQVEMLGPKAAFVRGKFLLTLSSGKQPHGLFTLVLREFPEGWRIIHDHSSGD
jgi:ketosteroid isomerase-like protein